MFRVCAFLKQTCQVRARKQEMLTTNFHALQGHVPTTRQVVNLVCAFNLTVIGRNVKSIPMTESLRQKFRCIVQSLRFIYSQLESCLL